MAKAAALYWPKIGRIVPSGYPTRDPRTVRVLADELGFVVDVPPQRGAEQIANRFHDLVLDQDAELRLSYRVDPRATRHHNPRSHTGALAWIHLDKVHHPPAMQLAESGLAISRRSRERPDHWIGMHPKLGSVYMCALADQIARRNQMYAITDRATEHGVLNGWPIDRLAAALGGTPAERRGDPEEISAAFATLAVQAVVPQNLADIPIEKIVEARRRLETELFAFRGFVDSFGSVFKDLAGVARGGFPGGWSPCVM